MAKQNFNSQLELISNPNSEIPSRHNQKTIDLIQVSERKIKANQRNAKKSTGPRTSRGKSYSRQNAIKHGFFASIPMGIAWLGEDPLEYSLLLEDFRNLYRPIGKAEELEVERIALCWWKHRRAHRHEHWAMVRSQVLADDRIRKQLADCDQANKEDQAIILELHNAEKQIKESGLGPWLDEVKQRLFVRKPAMEEVWEFLSTLTEREFHKLDPKIRRLMDHRFREVYLTRSILLATIQFLERLVETRLTEAMDFAQAEHVVPNSETLNRLLRYEAATDRNLSRSIDRLTSLQRQRQSNCISK